MTERDKDFREGGREREKEGERETERGRERERVFFLVWLTNKKAKAE